MARTPVCSRLKTQLLSCNLCLKGIHKPGSSPAGRFFYFSFVLPSPHWVCRQVPKELEGDMRDHEVEVSLVDNREQDYVPPKKVLKPFTGEGFKLGAHVPVNVVTGSGVAHPPAPAAPQAAPQSTKPTVTPVAATASGDDSSPSTRLQIRLADGTRLVAKFSPTQRISDVRHFVQSSQPGGRPFVLIAPPSTVLKDETLTLAEANLLGASLLQKFL
eukprot:m.618449 g.618449  ORF g.618449 m.618449 type:complete len:216 (+) comp58186_c0_seq3:1070-1717(+)